MSQTPRAARHAGAAVLAAAAVVAALGALAAPAGAAISQVKLGYTGSPTTSMTVNFREDAALPASTATVHAIPAPGDPAGCPGAAGCRSASAFSYFANAPGGPYAFFSGTLSGLTAGTTYDYRVTTSVTPAGAGPFSFRTAAGGSAPFTAAVAGEVHIGDKSGQPAGYTGFTAAAGRIKAAGAELALATGDNVDTGTDETQWQRLLDGNSTLRDFFATTPYLSAVGNHETYNNLPQGTPSQLFLAEFANPVNGSDGQGRSYSFDYDNVHFSVLEANPTTGRDFFDSEVAWLRRDLAAAVDRGTGSQVVIVHSPPFHTRTGRVTPYENPEFRESLVPVMDRYGVEAVVSGHDKHNVRSRPLVGEPAPGRTPAVAPRPVGAGHGTTYLQVNTSGEYYPDFSSTQPWIAFAQPATNTAAFLKLSFAGSTIAGEYVKSDGSGTLDSFTIPQVAPKADPPPPRGDKGDPGPQGPKGDRGPRGRRGPAGRPCSVVRGRGGRLRVTCSGISGRRVRIALARAGRVVASASARARAGRAAATLRSRRRLRAGRYTLTVSARGGVLREAVRFGLSTSAPGAPGGGRPPQAAAARSCEYAPARRSTAVSISSEVTPE